VPSAGVIFLNNDVPGPAPSPPAPAAPAGGGGPDELREDAYLLEHDIISESALPTPAELVDGFSVAVTATALEVDVRATMLEVEVVERGNIIYLIAPFAGDASVPGEICFSYLPPGQHRPVVDPGFGCRGSRIEHTGRGMYMYAIDTTGFRGGVLTWHFWGTGAHQASQFGEIVIPERPAQLL
jgi:hypothetical protein